MGIPGGVFYGYRELLIVPGGGLQMAVPGMTEWISRLEEWDFDDLDSIPYDYRVFHGDAPDAFPGAYIPIGFTAKRINLDVRDNWIDVRYTFAGEPAHVDQQKMRNFGVFQAVTGFMVRNKTPGCVGKFQLCAWR